MRLACCSALVLSLAGCGGGATSTPAPDDLGSAPAPDFASAAARDFSTAPPGDLAPPEWTLAWSDEFNGPMGAIDSTRWTFDTGGGGWGNGELENYTNRTDNAIVDGNGDLQIIARAESYQGSNYTSARINTSGRF